MRGHDTGRRAAGSARRRVAQPADPEGHAATSSPTAGPASSSSARRTAWSRCTAPTSCRSRALGLDAGRDDPRPSLRGSAAARSSCATPTATPRSCATKARCIAELRRAPRRDRAPARRGRRAAEAARRSTTRRCSTRSPRWSSGRTCSPAAFEREFLAVPPECLVLTMKANQKYFPLLDADGRLTNRFLVVSNIAPADPSRVDRRQRARRPAAPGRRQVLLRPGPQARRSSRASPALDKVVYHGKLGSQGERVARVRAIAGGDRRRSGRRRRLAGAGRSRRAARQGRPADRHGRRVPRAAGHHGPLLRAATTASDGEVAIGDRGPLPAALRRRRAAAQPRRRRWSRSPTSWRRWSACSRIGQMPTGDKDPFALRRHALGVLRMLIERLPALSLDALIDAAIAAPPGRPRRARVDGRVARQLAAEPRRAARLLRRAPRRARSPIAATTRRDRRGASPTTVLAARRGRAAPASRCASSRPCPRRRRWPRRTSASATS